MPEPPKEGTTHKVVGFSSGIKDTHTAVSNLLPRATVSNNDPSSIKLPAATMPAVSKTTPDFKTTLKNSINENKDTKILSILLDEKDELIRFKKIIYMFLNENSKFLALYGSDKNFKNLVNGSISTVVIDQNLQQLSLNDLVPFIAMLKVTTQDAENRAIVLSTLFAKLKTEGRPDGQGSSLKQRNIEHLMIDLMDNLNDENKEDTKKDLSMLINASKKTPISVRMLKFIIMQDHPYLNKDDKKDLLANIDKPTILVNKEPGLITVTRKTF